MSGSGGEKYLHVRTKIRRRLGSHAVTLIELLCVLAIIAVLAALLLGPVSRVMKNARAMQWADIAERQTNLVVEELRRFLGDRVNYPLLTLDGLEGTGALGLEQVRFLRDKRVTFTPFSGADPDETIIISVQLESGFLTSAGAITVAKSRLKPPK